MVEWSRFIGGRTDGVHSPKVVPIPSGDAKGGFHLYSTGDRPLIRFDSSFNLLWEVWREKGVNDVDEVNAVAQLGSSETLMLATVYQGPARIFGRDFANPGQFLVRLNSNDGSVISVGAIVNCRITAVAAHFPEGYVIAGVGAGTAKIGDDEFEIGAESVFLRMVMPPDNWTLLGAGATTANAHQIDAIRIEQNIFIAGTAPGAWNFGGKPLAEAGAYWIRISNEGEVIDTRTFGANSRFIDFSLNANLESHLVWKDRATSAGFITKLQENGSSIWQKPIGDDVRGVTSALTPYAIGIDRMTDLFLAALDENGNETWRINERRRSPTEGLDAAMLSDGRIVFTGAIQPAGAFFNDELLHDFSLIEVNSSDAFIAVLNPLPTARPVFQSNPVGQANAIKGEAVVLKTDVWSPGNSTLQWFKNDQTLAGETGRDLTIASIQPVHAGTYHAVATQNGVSVRSSNAVVALKQISVRTMAGPEALNSPRNPILLPDGSIVFTDTGNHVVKRIGQNGVTIYAGLGEAGLAGGDPLQARFSSPTALALQLYFNSGSKLFIADRGNELVRRILFSSQTGDATSVTTDENQRFPGLVSVASVEGFPHLVVGEEKRLWKLRDGEKTAVAGTIEFGKISAVAIDARATIFVADSLSNAIHKIDLNGVITLLAGRAGTAGFADGLRESALFNDPSGLALDDSGNVFVTERGNHAIRKISASGHVTTLAGLGRSGFADGDVTEALFDKPEGICWREDSLIIADTGNNRIRELKFEPITDSPNSDISLTIVADDRLRIFLSGQAGDNCAIESSATVTGGWTTETTAVIAIPAEAVILNRPGATRYYRAKKL